MVDEGEQPGEESFIAVETKIGSRISLDSVGDLVEERGGR